ncbi:TetR/AcrR family transcriptional regulator [Crossiella cryophila]|uniref:AcrR family transcriptional regulator n=1 Tax=Crossiella cryophila TaxID=43355 RepID=A0A7W7FYU7_9PSEU|nr:TetR/AcrR family transcriptional regulator C-terminal domain-containing protein [Crossiella cryophila]MBB4680439.1 AcrR family transcriptional regulator [Crossiella cryophila]
MTEPERPALTRDRIVAAALRLVEADGLDKLSVRKLGAALGVEGMAIYHHIPNKDALLQALVDRVNSLEDTPVPEELPWRDRLRAHYQRFRRVVRSHPNLAQLVLTRPARDKRSADATEAQCRALAAGGLAGPALLLAHRTIGSYVVGFLSIEVRAALGDQGQSPSVQLNLAEDYPFLSGLYAVDDSLSWDEQFDAGLSLLFDAVAALGGKDPRRQPG